MTMPDDTQLHPETQSHPDYADGYYAGFQGHRFDIDRCDSEEYAEGFEQGDIARSRILSTL